VQGGINVNALSTTAQGVTVHGSGRTFEASYLIAADGCNSSIARIMGMNKSRTAYCYLFSKGYYMGNVKALHPMSSSRASPTNRCPRIHVYLPRPYGDDLTVVFLSLDPRSTWMRLPTTS